MKVAGLLRWLQVVPQAVIRVNEEVSVLTKVPRVPTKFMESIRCSGSS